MSESATPEPVGLSVDQAIEALTAPPVEEQADEAPVEAAGEATETEGADQAPEDPEGEAEQPPEGEETEAEAEAVAPAEPPKYWSQDAKAEFAQLPPALQAVVLAQEGPREEAAAKAKSEAAAQTAQAQAKVAEVAQLADAISSFLPQAVAAFKTRWGEDPDWKAFAAEHGADQMIIAKLEHDEELALLQKTAQASTHTQAVAKQAYFDAEHKALAEIAPDLADPVEGPKRRAEVVTYLRQAGYGDDELEMMSARDMVMARKAKLYDDAQAALKTRPKTASAPTAPVSRAPVRPAATPAQTPTQRSAAQVANRFAQTRSVDDAVALLMSRKA